MCPRLCVYCYRLLEMTILVLWALQSGSAQVRSPHSRLTLISEQNSIQPGQTFWAGLHFQLENHWHIYWVNPGDSGEPPRVIWNLPAGFHAGSLRWPAPHRLQSSSLVDYGYEHDVLLMVPVRVPARLRPQRMVELRAKVNWLVCRDICIPGQQSLTLRLPVRNDNPGVNPQAHALFERTRAELPHRLPDGWRVAVVSEANRFILTLRTGARESAATFFPLEPLQINNAAAQQVTPFDRGICLAIQKSDQLLKPIPSLKGVVALSHGKAFVIDAPVTSQGVSGKSSTERRFCQ